MNATNPKHEFRSVSASELSSVQGGGILRDIVMAVGRKIVQVVRDVIKQPRPRC
jgi:uncharacterized protein (DUF697 family)